MGWIGNNTDATCPYINGQDHRCDQRLTLRRLDQAFGFCLGGYLACPTYQQLSWESVPRDASDDQPHFAPASTAAGPTPGRVSPRPAVAGPGPRLVRLTLHGHDPAPAASGHGAGRAAEA
jgi:hypothetical protein